jgi:tRNA A37 methylthiotransferase MiaB
MQKIMVSKPNLNLLHTIEQLRVSGFNPVMLGSINYNVQKIRLAGKDRVRKILEELSRKGGVLRKRLMSLHRVYPKHEEFVEKMRRVDEKGLAAILKRINFLAQTKVYLFWKHLEKLESFGVE